MTQLIFLIAFISAETRKFTQTLNVGINLRRTEDAYKGMTKYLLSGAWTVNTNSELAVESKHNA